MARRRRQRLLAVVLLALVLVPLTVYLLSTRLPGRALNASGSPAGGASPSRPAPSPTPPPLPPLPFHNAQVTLPGLGARSFVSWSLLDRRTGQVWGSTNTNQTTWTASMIKGWLAADYLHQKVVAGRTPTSSQLHTVEIMIRDSDNNAAATIYSANGRSASIRRMVSTCHLADSKPPGSGLGFGYTNVSARDTVKIADCIASGTAAGPQWTPWLLDKMRTVRLGDFGIRKALPPAESAQVAIKNGWDFFTDDHLWHVNCMAAGDTWTMAVLLRYPSAAYPGPGNWDTEFAKGQQLCQSVATQLRDPAS